ncbi:MAG TPA: FtsX-like permease family protein [Actinomycetales bacterium]
MSALELAWRLARAGGRYRIGFVVAGNAVGAALFLLTLAIPAATRGVEAPTSDERVLALSVVAFVCLPVTVLLMSIGRLSASSRDRNLAALRMLGVSPGRTRLVAAQENGILAATGAVLGVVAASLVAPLVSAAAAGPGWLLRPLRPPLSTVVLVGLAVVTLSAVVSLAPTRSLRLGPMRVRHQGAAARPSRWRLVPLALGGCVLAVMARPPELVLDWLVGGRQGYVVIAAFVATGIGLLLSLPLLVRATADLTLRLTARPTIRLAARRLQEEPAATVRVVAGLTIATFVITGAVGVLAAFQATPQYVGGRYAVEVGPQRHTVFLGPMDGVSPAAPTEEVRSRMAATPGVIAVIPKYDVEVAGCGTGIGYCHNVFVGTCAELQQRVPVSGCDDRRVSAIRAPWTAGAVPPSVVPLRVGDRQLDVPVTGTVVALEGPPGRDWNIGQLGLFVPLSTPALQLGAPTYLDVLTGPGTAPRTAVIDAAAAIGVGLFPQDVSDYQAVQGYRLLLVTLAVIVLGIGLLAVLITAVDRAVERRRELARQVAVGVPVRVLRVSQLLQTLVPLWLGLVPAVGLGYLAVLGYLRFGEVAGAGPGSTVLFMLIAALAGALVVSAATLPGIAARLTPTLLRRE